MYNDQLRKIWRNFVDNFYGIIKHWNKNTSADNNHQLKFVGFKVIYQNGQSLFKAFVKKLTTKFRHFAWWQHENGTYSQPTWRGSLVIGISNLMWCYFCMPQCLNHSRKTLEIQFWYSIEKSRLSLSSHTYCQVIKLIYVIIKNQSR